MAIPTPTRRASDQTALWRRNRFFGGNLFAVMAGVCLLTVAALVAWRWFGIQESSDGTAAWAPDGRTVVFTALRSGQADVFVMDVDGTDRRAITDTPSDEGAPAFAPDGQQIVFDSDRDGNFEIYVMASNGGDVHRLTQNHGRDLSPSWSPDGRSIVFLSDRDSKHGLDVYVMDADGSDVERITTSGNLRGVPQCSPDGRWIAVTMGDELQVLENSTRTLHRLTYAPDNGAEPTWSPDSRRITFSRTANGGSDLFTMLVDGTSQSRLVSMPAGDARDPHWSPDGTQLLFTLAPRQGGDRTRPRPTSGSAVYLMELRTGKLTRLSR